MKEQPTILVIIFLNFKISQYRSDLPQVKGNLIFSIANLVYELPHELPNDLRFRILGNWKILEKFQIWVDTQPSAQSPFKNLQIAVKKNAKTDTKLLFSCPVLLDYSILFQIFCLRLSEQANFRSLLSPVPFQLQFFNIFYNFKAFL